MLKKLHRLRKNKDFSKIFRNSKRFETENLTFRVAKNFGSFVARFGFVVSNNIDKRSSRRNGLKRRMRAAVRKVIGESKGGYDTIIGVKCNFSYPYAYSDIEKQVLEGLKKANLLG